MSDYIRAWDALTAAIGAAKGDSSGYFDSVEHLTVDQRIEVAKVAALLSISQELSGIRHGEGGFAEQLDSRLQGVEESLRSLS